MKRWELLQGMIMAIIVEESSMDPRLKVILHIYRYPVDFALLSFCTAFGVVFSETYSGDIGFYIVIISVWLIFFSRPLFQWYFFDTKLLDSRGDGNNLKERTWINLLEKNDKNSIEAALRFGYSSNQYLHSVQFFSHLSGLFQRRGGFEAARGKGIVGFLPSTTINLPPPRPPQTFCVYVRG